MKISKLQPKKAIAIVGPTATGKTKLAIRLALAFKGEIVSADSRQVYRGMDVGSGKDLHEFKVKNSAGKLVKVPYHCIDVVSPKTEYNVAKWLKAARKAIADIQKRGKMPIVVGGTGLYVQALVEGYSLAFVAPDAQLRMQLEKKNIKELKLILRKLDPGVNDLPENKRYLVRYIETLQNSGKTLHELMVREGSDIDWLVIGIDKPREEINRRIDGRLKQRIADDSLVEEVMRLHDQGLSWKRLERFGLEYRFVSRYLRGEYDRPTMLSLLATAIHQFAKRQMTYLRRWEKQGRAIVWVKNYGEAKRTVGKWVIRKWMK